MGLNILLIRGSFAVLGAGENYTSFRVNGKEKK